MWAAGHLEKSREVTRSGPYRFTRHPLYLGSSVIGPGYCHCVQRAAVVAALIALYLASTIPAAMRAEEAHLREKFGGGYDAYASRTAVPMARALQPVAGTGQPGAPYARRAPSVGAGAACAQGPAFATIRGLPDAAESRGG